MRRTMEILRGFGRSGWSEKFCIIGEVRHRLTSSVSPPIVQVRAGYLHGRFSHGFRLSEAVDTHQISPQSRLKKNALPSGVIKGVYSYVAVLI